MGDLLKFTVILIKLKKIYLNTHAIDLNQRFFFLLLAYSPVQETKIHTFKSYSDMLPATDQPLIRPPDEQWHCWTVIFLKHANVHTNRKKHFSFHGVCLLLAVITAAISAHF